MPIKAIKLRAVFLLLLFTLMFISSNSFITEIQAGESLEESFKSTPLPFWEINNENILTQYGIGSQNILFTNYVFHEDGTNVNNWQEAYTEDLNDNFTFANGIIEFRGWAKDSGTDYDVYFSNSPSTRAGTFYLSIRGRLLQNQVNGPYFRYYDSDDISGNSAFFGMGGFTDYEVRTRNFTFNFEYGIESLRIDCYTNNLGEWWNFQIEYILLLWVEYEEDMSDVSDWSYDSSFGLAGGEYSFTTDGDIGDLLILTGGGTDEWVMYKTPMNYLITDFTRFSIRNKVTDNQMKIFTRITGTDLDVCPSYTQSTDWIIQNADITASAGKTIDWLYIRLDDNPDGIYGWQHGYFDYIEIWEVGGSINVSIPIEQFKNHKLEFMVDTDNLPDTTKLEFGIFQDYNSMNYDFSLENQIFEQREFSFNYSEYNYLRFKLDLKYSTNLFKITCYDENNSKLFDNLVYEYVRKTGNQFIISSVNFTDWFHLYYFTGSLNYETTWKEIIVDEDLNIDYSMLASSALGDDMLNDHEIIYNRFVSSFQFLRTNMFEYTYFSANLASELGVMLDIQFFYPDGTEFYRVNGKLYRTYNELVFFMKAYETIDSIESEIFSSACGSDLGTTEIEGNIQFAIWRTQDNHLASFYNPDADNFPDISEISRFLSDKTLDNFQANISITYFSEDILSGYRNFVIELEGFELGYGDIKGVAEPHFSSTWWDSIPIIGPLINAIMIAMNTIGSAIESGFAPLFTIIDSSVNTVTSAIAGLAGGIWVLFEGALNDIGLSLDSMASDIWTAFDTAITGIANVLDNVYSTLADIFTSIEGLVVLIEIIDTVIDNISTGISSLITGLNDLTGIVTTISNIATSINTAIDTISTIISSVLITLTDLDAVIDTFYGAFVTVATVIDTVSAIVNNVYTTLQNIATNFSTWVGNAITTTLIPAILAGIESVIDATFALWEYQLNLVGTALGWGAVGTFLFDFTDSVVLAVPSWLEFLINSISFMVEILVWINFMWNEYSATLILYGSLLVLFDIITALLSFDDQIILECVGRYLSVIEKIVIFMYNIISTILNAIWGILPF